MSAKNIPLQKKSRAKTSLQSTKSRGGEWFLPLDCRAKACIKMSICGTGSQLSRV